MTDHQQKKVQKDETLKVKIGGRIVGPAFDIADGGRSIENVELSFDRTLQEFAADNIPLESMEGIQRRERVLNRMQKLCQDWVKSVCRKQGLPRQVVDAAGGVLKTSGSYRLGVHEPGADIDCILVVPGMCNRQHFFGTTTSIAAMGDDPKHQRERDPDSLAERIRAHPDVTNFVPVEGAKVPILTFDWEGVNIDLLFARLSTPSVPENFDVDVDSVLDGADFATEKSLNGPRVTNLIAALMSGTPGRYQSFLTVVRCVRKWAKARGLYSNKFGYWGGVNINIAVALVVQLFPNKCPATLLRLFFLTLKHWRWPKPMTLTKVHDAGYGLQVWTASVPRGQVAPILTPAYPSMNSTISMSLQTMQIMTQEFSRGLDIVSKLWKEHQANPTKELDWKELFRPSDFFIEYPYYLSLCIVGPTQSEAQAWAGYVESRLRKLVADMLGRSLPLIKIQLWPKKIEACIADRSSLLTFAQRRNSVTYMIGFQVDKLRMRGNELNVELQMKRFRDQDLARFTDFVDGMDVLTKSFKCKNLPAICFEIYDGGKLAAMRRRRMLRDADPKRQEKRRMKKLAELKAKMDAIRKRKAATMETEDTEEMDLGDEKRPRADSDLHRDSAQVKADTVEAANQEKDVVEDGTDDEEALLESALNLLGEGEGELKTQEEAEADRKKLLSGELLGEGAQDIDDGDLGYYTGDNARQSVIMKNAANKAVLIQDIRALPMQEEEAELLRKAGYTIVDEAEKETKVIGGNMPTPFRSNEKVVEEGQSKLKAQIKFRTKWDIVELDIAGRVLDKGDNDFQPSRVWTGRVAGFEFKLGERGLGYYRTGKPVVIPSNSSYS